MPVASGFFRPARRLKLDGQKVGALSKLRPEAWRGLLGDAIFLQGFILGTFSGTMCIVFGKEGFILIIKLLLTSSDANNAPPGAPRPEAG